MRSTPLFLGDKLYHIRYDLNAAWDMECIIRGGLYSILDRPITFQYIIDLLWFGLKWDNPDLTVSDTREIVTGEIKRKHSLLNRIKDRILNRETTEILLPILRSCKNEMFISGWFESRDSKETVSAVATVSGDAPKTGVETIIEFERMAQYCRYAGDPWKLTPNEIYQLVKVHNDQLERQDLIGDYHTAMICSSLFNSHRTSDKDPVVSWSDFMPKKDSGSAKMQTAENHQNIISQLNALCGGEVK